MSKRTLNTESSTKRRQCNIETGRCQDDPALHLRSQHQSLFPWLPFPKNTSTVEKYSWCPALTRKFGSSLNLLIIQLSTHDKKSHCLSLRVGIFQGVELLYCNLLHWTESIETNNSFPQFSIYLLAIFTWRKSRTRRAVIFDFSLYYLHFIPPRSPEPYLGHQELRREVIAGSWYRTSCKCCLWRLLTVLIGEVMCVEKWFSRFPPAADN